MLKVLIIDDEEKVCRLIQCLIDWESLGLYIAGICHDGLLALDMVKETSPDIIITDIRMPGWQAQSNQSEHLLGRGSNCGGS